MDNRKWFATVIFFLLISGAVGAAEKDDDCERSPDAPTEEELQVGIERTNMEFADMICAKARDKSKPAFMREVFKQQCLKLTGADKIDIPAIKEGKGDR